MIGNTPMLLQYRKIKNEYKDCILFYRLGDFYEMFGEDAQRASGLLEIALTSRDAGEGLRIPMCGVPHHSVETYIAKLVSRGIKVAICEQMEDPATAKGIVRREVVKIITPGTTPLAERENNYLCAIFAEKEVYALATADISTGAFKVTDKLNSDELLNELAKYNPSECIFPKAYEKNTEISNKIRSIGIKNINYHYDYSFRAEYSTRKLLELFKINSLQSLDLDNRPGAICAAGAIVDYLIMVQKSPLTNIINLKYYSIKNTMQLDYASKKNLELIETISGAERNLSLFSILDLTNTAAGTRMLKDWLNQPLIEPAKIEQRLHLTEFFFLQSQTRKNIRALLEKTSDIQRLTSKLSYGNVNGRDLLSIKKTLELIPFIKAELNYQNNSQLQKITAELDELTELSGFLSLSLKEEPPLSIKDGGIIKDNYSAEVDELREITGNGKDWILRLEQAEKERTGIKNLKIGYNRVFGYYIEITKSYLGATPGNYIRKQTLANAERFITPELKEIESKVLGADERLKKIEYELFLEIREKTKKYLPDILKNAVILASLDCFSTFAEVAVLNNYCKPIINPKKELLIEELRHPVVEKHLNENTFIPNHVSADNERRMLLITGPNMAGKSTYCRSIALAAIMMQIGSFVPAQKAVLPVFDRIFARIGASDSLATGKSTFMVEMNEVSNIINNATEKSLIILDEVGRGTSTFDGVAIAWSLIEYINEKIKALTFFTTHYHELTELENIRGIENLSVAVKESGEEIIFLRKIVAGASDKSYGIHVAKLAGLPEDILQRAYQILGKLENKHTVFEQSEKPVSKSRTEPAEINFAIKKELLPLLEKDISEMTPLEALNYLNQLQVNLSKLIE